MQLIPFFLMGSFLISILLGVIMIPNILLVSYKKRLFDIPDSRKVHTCPIPRLGGISFLPAIVITFSLVMGFRYIIGLPVENLPLHRTFYKFLFWLVGSMLLYLVGVQDDLIGVDYRNKFLVQFLAATFLAVCGDWINSLNGIFGIDILPTWIGIPFTIFVIVYITNAINLMDGIDGLASGLCCIALITMGYMHFVHEQYVYVILALATLGILIPFWCYNVFGNAGRGQKLFMGDAGSLTLGYTLSFLLIHLSIVKPELNGHYVSSSLLTAFSSLLVPLFDVVRVVIRRLRIGKSPFRPDQNHFHHKLLRTGMHPRWVLITILLVSLFFIAFNILMRSFCSSTAIFLLDIALWVTLHVILNQIIAYRQRTIGLSLNI